jgi:hypothetical protein
MAVEPNFVSVFAGPGDGTMNVCASEMTLSKKYWRLGFFYRSSTFADDQILPTAFTFYLIPSWDRLIKMAS